MRALVLAVLVGLALCSCKGGEKTAYTLPGWEDLALGGSLSQEQTGDCVQDGEDTEYGRCVLCRDGTAIFACVNVGVTWSNKKIGAVFASFPEDATRWPVVRTQLESRLGSNSTVETLMAGDVLHLNTTHWSRGGQHVLLSQRHSDTACIGDSETPCQPLDSPETPSIAIVDTATAEQIRKAQERLLKRD